MFRGFGDRTGVAGLSRATGRGALATVAASTVIAVGAGGVRLFPWLLDPQVTWRVAAPFARSVTVVALEAAVAVGWPLGWALALVGFVNRGEARVLALLGERPATTVLRLKGQTLAFTLLIGALAWTSAKESREPGRVVDALIAEGGAACAGAGAPRTYAVPFLGATWLCAPGTAPRLVGEGPGALSSMVVSARSAEVSGDLGGVVLGDARLALKRPPAALHVDTLRLEGAPPWGHGAAISPLARAFSLSAAVGLSATAAALAALSRRTRGHLFAVVTGAVGPAAALGLLRAAERFASARDALVVLTPLVAAGAVALVAWVGARLPSVWHTASR